MTKIYATLAVVVVCLICLAVISRNWSCRQQREFDRTAGPYKVVSVDSGASLTYLRRGDRDKERLHESLTLAGVASPAKGQPGFEEATASLASIVGFEVGDNGPAFSTITILETKDARFDRWEAGDVLSESGQCLQVEQLKAGWAWCRANPPKAYAKAEKEAKEAKRGIWGMKAYQGEWMVDEATGDPCPPFPEMDEEEFENQKAKIAFLFWMDVHAPSCEQCNKSKGADEVCDMAKNKYAELVKKYEKVTK